MVFSTPIFLFHFLPILLFLYYFIQPSYRIHFLLVCSLFFYLWAEPRYFWVLILTLILTTIAAGLIRRSSHPGRRNLYLSLGIISDLVILVVFKYSDFFLSNLNPLFRTLHLPALEVHKAALPLGISFYTFLSLSYLIDTYRNSELPKNRIFAPILYLSFFPTILAGPITPYREMASQFFELSPGRDAFGEGARRFIIGLAKKVLLADTLGKLSADVFALPLDQITFSLSWTGMIAFTLQIYLDFSAYTDMAIGLGKMLGFRFMENFNYPYLAKSINDFWRRWHLSLTRWLRDYLFLPLSYRFLRFMKQDRCLGIRAESWAYAGAMLLTMFLCGLWHGAAWTFVFWGTFHGLLILGERFLWGRKLKKTWKPLQHGYALLAIIVGWVFFRSSNMAEAFSLLKTMTGFGNHTSAYTPSMFLNMESILVLFLSCAASTPLVPAIHRLWQSCKPPALRWLIVPVRNIILAILLALSYIYVANATFQPFIYFRF